MGVDGVRGSQGPQGLRGDRGETGSKGVQTAVEAYGDPGDPGDPGTLFCSVLNECRQTPHSFTEKHHNLQSKETSFIMVGQKIKGCDVVYVCVAASFRPVDLPSII